MIEAIITGWWKVIALLFSLLAVTGGAVFLSVFFIKKAKESGVDEISAGPVKLDFENKEK